MKFKSLHSKNNFLKFLSLSLLVIAGSVGVVLSTQKQIFDESEAGEQCTSSETCYSAIDGNTICIGNVVHICTPKFGRYSYRPFKKCSQGYVCTTINNNRRCEADCVIDHSNDCNIEGITRCNAGWVERCIDGVYKPDQYCPNSGRDCMYVGDRAWCEKLPDETKRTPKATSKSTPKPAGTCEYSCVTNCTSSGGTHMQGNCSSGKVCCALPNTPY